MLPKILISQGQLKRSYAVRKFASGHRRDATPKKCHAGLPGCGIDAASTRKLMGVRARLIGRKPKRCERALRTRSAVCAWNKNAHLEILGRTNFPCGRGQWPRNNVPPTALEGGGTILIEARDGLFHGQPMWSSSTSNSRVAFGGMAPG
jgi:hypothetical protein